MVQILKNISDFKIFKFIKILIFKNKKKHEKQTGKTNLKKKQEGKTKKNRTWADLYGAYVVRASW